VIIDVIDGKRPGTTIGDWLGFDPTECKQDFTTLDREIEQADYDHFKRICGMGKPDHLQEGTCAWARWLLARDRLCVNYRVIWDENYGNIHSGQIKQREVAVANSQRRVERLCRGN